VEKAQGLDNDKNEQLLSSGELLMGCWTSGMRQENGCFLRILKDFSMINFTVLRIDSLFNAHL